MRRRILGLCVWMNHRISTYLLKMDPTKRPDAINSELLTASTSQKTSQAKIYSGWATPTSSRCITNTSLARVITEY